MLQENFIAYVAQDNGVEARAALQDDLSARVLASLEERKRELAKGLFSGGAQQVAEEKEDAEKHDDEEEDEKLVKKLVKKDCLTKEATDLTAFKKAGGKITQVPPHAAHGAQAKEETVIEEKIRPHKDPERGWVGQSKAYYKAVQKKRQTPEQRKAWIKQSEDNRK